MIVISAIKTGDIRHVEGMMCADMDPQWLMFISLSSSSLAEKAEKLTGSHSRVRKLTRHAVWVLLNSGIVTKRTSWPSGPVRERRSNIVRHIERQIFCPFAV